MLSIQHLIYRFDYEATGTRLFYAFSKFKTNKSLSKKDDFTNAISGIFPWMALFQKIIFQLLGIFEFFFSGNFHPLHSFTSRSFQNFVLKGHVPCFAWSYNCINLGHWSFLNPNSLGLYMETNPVNGCVVFLFAKTTCITRSLQLVWS